MRPSSFFYQIRQGFRNIGRNRMFSLASVATMTACIFIFGVLFSVLLNVDSLRKDIEEKVGVTVFFDENIDDGRVGEIGEEIRSLPHVTDVTFTSAEEAWETYKKEHFASNPSLAEGFKENPLANSASYTVFVDRVEVQSETVEKIRAIEGVRQVNQSSGAVKNLMGFNRAFTYVSAVIIVILLIVSVVLIANVISVGITTRKEEIAIMKLIGATDAFVRAPFIVEGLLLGLLGTLLPLGILFIVYNWLLGRLLERFGFLGDMRASLLDAGSVFSMLVPIGLVLGVGVGLFGAWITVKKHLDV